MSASDPATAPPPSTPRRFLVLAAALAMMWGVRALRVDGPAVEGAADPLSLAACGFVLLAAFTVGELGAGLGLPKVTGYVLAGALVGPQVADILSDAVVADLSTFNTLALGLIAIRAGLELHVPAIRRVARTLIATIVAKLALLPVLYGVPVLLATRALGRYGLDRPEEHLVFALIVAVLAIGTSPSITLAVVSDTRARGRLTDLVMAMAVAKDLVVVTALAVALGVARALLSGGGFHADAMSHIGTELGASVVAGVAVGVVFVAYFRFVAVEPLFSALVAILLAAEASRYLHLELLLVFIVAGFVVRNFSRYEHDLLDPIERIALPVFVVFFTTAGAGVDLRGTLAILPFAAGLAVLRAVAFSAAARFGARLGREPPEVAENAWLTYLPQAGVTLGLVLLAAESLPELAEPIRALGLALVALHLGIGPVTLAVALRRAGETRDPAAQPDDTAPPAPVPRAAAPAASVTSAPRPAEPDPEPHPDPDVLPDPVALAGTLADPRLAAVTTGVAERIEAMVRRFVAGAIRVQADALAARAAALTADDVAERVPRLRQVKRALAEAPPYDPLLLDRAGAALFDEVSAFLRAQRWTVTAPLDDDALRLRPTDGWGARLRRAGARWRVRWARLLRRRAVRRVPLQLALRIALEPRVAEAVLGVAASFHRAEAELLALVRVVSQGGGRDPDPDGPPESDRARAERVAHHWADLAEHELTSAVRAGLQAAVAQLRIAGGPALPARSLRFADVEVAVGDALRRLSGDAPAWRAAVGAAEDSLRAALLAETFVTRLRSAVDRRALQPLAGCREALLPTLTELGERLGAVGCGEGPADGEALGRVLATIEQVVSAHHASGLRRITARFRRGTQPGPLVAELADIVRNAPERLRVVSRHTPVARARHPADVVVREVAFADVVEAVLHDELLPAVDAALAPVAELVASAEGRVREAVTVARYGTELAARGGFDEDERRQVVADAIHRGVRQIRRLAEQVGAACDQAEAQLTAAADGATRQLRGLSADEGIVAAARTVRTSVRSVGDAVRRALARAVRRGRALGERARSLTNQQALRNLKIRSGHEQLDATGIREYLDRWLAPPETRGLPPVYVRLMSPAPVTDRRLFVARGALLDQVLDALAPEPKVPAPTTVLVGPEGAGRTSLLNMVKTQLVGPRVLWLDPAFSSRRDGPVRALATELGTSSEVATVVGALRREPTVVLIDDLHCWLEPSPRGLRELEVLLGVIDRSADATRWVVSLDAASYALLAEVVPLREVFRRVAALGPLDWTELKAIFDQREQLGGFDTDYRARGWSGRLGDLLRPGRHAETYFRALARASRGNPGTASTLHLQGVTLDDQVLRASVPGPPELPFVGQLGDEMLAVLGALARFGPMDRRWLGALLGGSSARGTAEAVSSALGFLHHAGLVGERARRIGVVPRLGPAVRRELARMGVLPEEAA